MKAIEAYKLAKKANDYDELKHLLGKIEARAVKGYFDLPVWRSIDAGIIEQLYELGYYVARIDPANTNGRIQYTIKWNDIY